MVGGSKALVVTAERHRLVVICSTLVATGPVCVKTPDGEATGPRDFKVLPWTLEISGVDGPPYSFEGVGNSTAVDLRTRLFGTHQPGDSSTTLRTLDVPKVGTVKVLCIAGYPRDLPPADQAATLADIKSTLANVTKYYKQASYSQLDVNFDVVGFFKMANKVDRYYSAASQNFISMDQIQAECLNFAQNVQGRDPNAYGILMVIINTGAFTRGNADGFGQNIHFQQPSDTDQDALNITITLAQSKDGMALDTSSDWGRIAHEFGHNVVIPGLVLPEDIYESSPPVPGEDFTGADFDIMGWSDSHPLFSGFNMNDLGWFSPSNVRVLGWNTSPFSQEIEIVAHGLTQNTDPSRCHLVRIDVSNGLQYFIEVRQKPGATAQIFDSSIPVPAGHDGGVLVTRAVTGTLNNNQNMRLITRLQTSPNTLTTGEIAVDPLRTILITVMNDNVQASPLVCRVKIEWAQPASPTPGGTFDLWIQQWGANYTTPDIWIDRQPFFPAEPYDNQNPSGDPINGGDAPRVGEVNHFSARIRNDGTSNANNVVASFYVNTPPGIGDSGNWTPLSTFTLNVPAGGNVVQTADWVPRVGEHTCLQVAIVPQTGEKVISNNKAQENVFTFLPASHSVPEPVELPIAVRNPLNKRTLIRITINGVPEGIYVYFPRRWLYLEALAEQTLELLVIPLREIKDLKTKVAKVRVQGYIPWSYTIPQPISNRPSASVARLIGGIQAIVAPKVGSRITLQPNPTSPRDNTATVRGNVTPTTEGQNVRVDMTLIDNSRVVYRVVKTNARGEFVATFSVLEEVRTVVEVAFQAHIINATVLAPADSNIVHYKVKVVPHEPEPPS